MKLLYSAEHEWLEPQGLDARIGITAFAAGELGDIVYVDVQVTGKTIGRGEVFGTVEAVKTVSDLYMPVSGIVLEVNPKVIHGPGLINDDPYGEGWLVKIGLTEPEEVSGLLTADEYRSQL
jgi:glycine cleavage system H protein